MTKDTETNANEKLFSLLLQVNVSPELYTFHYFNQRIHEMWRKMLNKVIISRSSLLLIHCT